MASEHLRLLPDDAPLEPGRGYVAEIVFESAARGERLRKNAEAAIYQALDELRNDPETWLSFRPERIEVEESVDPNNPDLHRVRIWFRILDIEGQGVSPAAGPLIVAGWILGIFAAGLLSYFAFNVVSRALYVVERAAEDVANWAVPLLVGALTGFLLVWLVRRLGAWDGRRKNGSTERKHQPT